MTINRTRKWLALLLVVVVLLAIPAHGEGWRQLESYAARVARVLYSGSYHGSTTTVSLTSAQLKNLKATPVSLLPAPGAGEYYVVFSVVANYHFGTIAYGNVDPDALDIVEGTLGNQNGLVQLNDNEIINSEVTSRIYQKVGQSFAGPVDPSTVVNQPLLLENASASELTSGDGTLVLTIYYTTETF